MRVKESHNDITMLTGLTQPASYSCDSEPKPKSHRYMTVSISPPFELKMCLLYIHIQ